MDIFLEEYTPRPRGPNLERAAIKRRAELGIPASTGTTRLNRMILFSVLKKHSENICCRCGKPIETYLELSVDHKKPWQGNGPEAFWDLDNIGFSHPSCNSRAGRGTKGMKFPARGGPYCQYPRVFGKGPKSLVSVGMRFGRLLVIEFAGYTHKSMKRQWLCACDCGNKIVTRAEYLTKHNKRHCGCEIKKRRAGPEISEVGSRVLGPALG